MKAPTVRATIARRILVNYRVDPEVLVRLVPPPFRPVDVNGYAVAGICLIRLTSIRPAGAPRAAGLSAESAAHRVAVEWEDDSGSHTGVYIPRRDTSSALVAAAGGRVFPGAHGRARFSVVEDEGRFRITVERLRGEMRIVVAAHLAERTQATSVFADLDAASAFFRDAPIGYSATRIDGVFDGVSLVTDEWSMEPLALDHVSSTFFDDHDRFPPGSAEPDSAFLMQGIETTWRPLPDLTAPVRTAVTPQ